MHYTRWLRHGDPLSTTWSEDGPEGFEARVDRTGGPDACHPWQRGKDSEGYGVLQFDGRDQRAHQVAWQLANGGPVPPGAQLDHVCHNRAVAEGTCQPGPCPHRACANGRHIVAKTPLQHILDTKWTRPHGDRNGKSKLAERQIPEVRRMVAAGMYSREIAAVYGVSVTAISNIKSGRTWSWLT
jgi:hypothetical protein